MYSYRSLPPYSTVLYRTSLQTYIQYSDRTFHQSCVTAHPLRDLIRSLPPVYIFLPLFLTMFFPCSYGLPMFLCSPLCPLLPLLLSSPPAHISLSRSGTDQYDRMDNGVWGSVPAPTPSLHPPIASTNHAMSVHLPHFLRRSLSPHLLTPSPFTQN